jgi:hypothetical protein
MMTPNFIGAFLVEEFNMEKKQSASASLSEASSRNPAQFRRVRDLAWELIRTRRRSARQIPFDFAQGRLSQSSE